VQAVFTDLHGINHFHQFKNYRVNKANKYHIVKLKVSDFNSTLIVDGIATRKEIVSDSCKLNKTKFKKNANIAQKEL
jgi:hypothetical protein